MKKSRKPLSVKKETIRVLDLDLDTVRGGVIQPDWSPCTCAATCKGSCAAAPAY
jgi:hypothetical protein